MNKLREKLALFLFDLAWYIKPKTEPRIEPTEPDEQPQEPTPKVIKGYERKD